MGSFSIWHWMVVLLVVLLLFGGGKVSSLMGDFAKGIKSFKKNMAEPDDASMEESADKLSMHGLAYDAVIDTYESLPKPRRRDPQAVEEAVKRAVRAAISSAWPSCANMRAVSP